MPESFENKNVKLYFSHIFLKRQIYNYTFKSYYTTVWQTIRIAQPPQFIGELSGSSLSARLFFHLLSTHCLILIAGEVFAIPVFVKKFAKMSTAQRSFVQKMSK